MKIYRNQKPIAECNGKLVTYSKGVLYWKKDGGFSPICQLYKGTKNIFSKIRPIDRLARLTPRCGVNIDDKHIFVSISRRVVCVNVVTGEKEVEHTYRAGMKHPLQLVKIEGVEGFKNAVVYGEYWNNESREPVCIYRRLMAKTAEGRAKGIKTTDAKMMDAKTTDKWQKAYTFASGEVKHIHNIIPDVEHACVYVLTGDKDKESGIWRFREDFAKVEKVLVGNQKYRACFMAPLGSGLIYVTDCPDRSNYICYYDFLEKKLQNIKKIDGSCLSGTRLSDGRVVFSTTVEPNERTMGLYLFNNKRGDGIKDWYTHVYIGGINTGWKEIMKYKKDILPMSLFQFGCFSFFQTTDGKLYCYGMSVKYVDNCMIEVTP